jgi:hypothetical protein
MKQYHKYYNYYYGHPHHQMSLDSSIYTSKYSKSQKRPQYDFSEYGRKHYTPYKYANNWDIPSILKKCSSVKKDERVRFKEDYKKRKSSRDGIRVLSGRLNLKDNDYESNESRTSSMEKLYRCGRNDHRREEEFMPAWFPVKYWDNK